MFDKSGQPAGNKSYFASENSTGGYNPTITVRDVNEKVVDEFGGWMSSNPDPKTGRFQSKPLPSGRYTLKVWIPGGYQKPDIIMAAKEIDITYDKREIELGQIIISGITN